MISFASCLIAYRSLTMAWGPGTCTQCPSVVALHPIPRHAHQRIRMPWLPPDRRQPTGQLAPGLQIVGVPNGGISSYPRKLRVALAGEIPRDEALQPPRQLPPLPQGRAQPDRSIPREPGQLGLSVPQEVPRNGGDEASWELLPRLEVCTGPGRPARSS